MPTKEEAIKLYPYLSKISQDNARLMMADLLKFLLTKDENFVKSIMAIGME